MAAGSPRPHERGQPFQGLVQATFPGLRGLDAGFPPEALDLQQATVAVELGVEPAHQPIAFEDGQHEVAGTGAWAQARRPRSGSRSRSGARPGRGRGGWGRRDKAGGCDRPAQAASPASPPNPPPRRRGACLHPRPPPARGRCDRPWPRLHTRPWPRGLRSEAQKSASSLGVKTQSRSAAVAQAHSRCAAGSGQGWAWCSGSTLSVRS